MLFVVLPLVFHAVYGAILARDPDAVRSPYPEAWRKWLRITGYITFVFVLVHVWQTSAQKWAHGLSPFAFHTQLEARLSATSWGVSSVEPSSVITNSIRPSTFCCKAIDSSARRKWPGF